MAKTTIQKTGWQRVRKLINDIHLWLGLSSGLVLIVVCFSGTVYVFNTELTADARDVSAREVGHHSPIVGVGDGV